MMIHSMRILFSIISWPLSTASFAVGGGIDSLPGRDGASTAVTPTVATAAAGQGDPICVEVEHAIIQFVGYHLTSGQNRDCGRGRGRGHRTTTSTGITDTVAQVKAAKTQVKSNIFAGFCHGPRQGIHGCNGGCILRTIKRGQSQSNWTLPLDIYI
jgi:hypothetical protein